MLPLPAVSSQECVRVLIRMGYHAVDDHGGCRVLERGARRVAIPHHRVLDAETLVRILHSAGTNTLQFLDFLSLA